MTTEKNYLQACSDLKNAITNFKLAIGRWLKLEKIINWMKKNYG